MTTNNDNKILTGFTSRMFRGPNVSNNPNAWVITIGDWETLVSYDKKVVHRNTKTGQVYLDQKFLHISFTTALHRESFLGNPKPIIRVDDHAVIDDNLTNQRIASGQYILTDLNPDLGDEHKNKLLHLHLVA